MMSATLDQLFARGLTACREASLLRARAQEIQRSRGLAGPGELSKKEAQSPAPSKDAIYRQLFDRALVAYVRTDRKGVVLDANLAAARLLNMPPASFPGRQLLHFVARGDTRIFRALVRRLDDITEHSTIVQFRPRGSATLPIIISLAKLTQDSFGWVLRIVERPKGDSLG